VYPVTEAVAEEFQLANPGSRVTVGISGTGGGFQKFCRGEIDIAEASRPITPGEAETCAAAGVQFVELPVAYDGLAVVVHPNNTWAESMTVADLRTLWEPAAQTTVTRWNQIRPSWPDREIHLFGAGVDSGTFDYFTEAIAGKSGASRGDYTSSEDDNVIVQGVAGTPGGLGYFGFSYFEENQGTLNAVEIDGGGGCVPPSVDTAQGGTYVPLARPLFVYASTEALGSQDVEDFVRYMLENETEIAERAQFVPLNQEQIDQNLAKLDEATG
jgi:phosphate transport system substrate-binding protein